jgi:acetyl esterase/lipase
MIWLSSFLAAVSLLAVLKAPAKPLWFVAIAATEGGHLLALGSLAIAITSWRIARRWGAASWIALAAAVLYLTPLCRAAVEARRLPDYMALTWGAVAPRYEPLAPSRPRPLVIADLFKGIASPAVDVQTLVYAAPQGRSLELDLYRPSRPGGPMPVVMVVHGGSWQSGDRGEFGPLNRYLAARGYAVAAIDYRLAPAAIFPAQREDVFAAMDYLKGRALELHLDAQRFVLLGRSAGGQIALSAAYAQRHPEVKGAVVFYAPNDLAWAYDVPTNPLIMNSQKVIETYLGGPPASRPGGYDIASPLRQVNRNTPPTLMIHGVRDELVWAMHEVRLSERLAQEGRPYFYLRLPWATHGCDAVFNGPCGQLSTYAVERFLAAVMPPVHEEQLVQRNRPREVS